MNVRNPVLRCFLSLCLIVMLWTVFSDVAEARRLGGGRSMGRQSQTLTHRQAQPQQPQHAQQNAPGTPNAANQPRRPWAGILGGLAAGLGLAALANALGLGAGGGVMLLLILGAAIVAFLVFRRKAAGGARAPTPAWQAATGTLREYSPSKVGNDSSARPWEYAQGGASGAPAANLSGSQTWGIPADFDVEGFTATAKKHFVDLQTANDRGDVEALRRMMTSSMMFDVEQDLQQRQGTSVTKVESLNATLLGIEEQPDVYLASVEFSGTIDEDGAGAQPFREVWNMTKPRSGHGGWLIAGIQQLD